MKQPIDSALIFAAGLGSRMRPVTEKIPKPLVRINNFALIDIVINQIVRSGIKNIFINTFYKSSIVESYIKTRTDCNITIFKEEKRLETGGSLLSIAEKTQKKVFLTCNADTIWLEESNQSCIKNLLNTWYSSSDATKLAMILATQEKFFADDKTKKEFTLNSDSTISKSINPTHYYIGTQIIDVSIVQKKSAPFSLSDVYTSLSTNSAILRGALGLEFTGKIARHVDSVYSLNESRKYCSENMILEW